MHLPTTTDTVRRRLAAFALALAASLIVGLFGASSPASAAAVEPVEWGPLNSFYDGSERVRGHGTFHSEELGTAETNYVLTDTRVDGNPVYGVTDGYIYRTGLDGEEGWELAEVGSTSEIEDRTSRGRTSFDLHPEGQRARGQVQVCAQMGFPVPDSCSDAAFPTFDY